MFGAELSYNILKAVRFLGTRLPRQTRVFVKTFQIKQDPVLYIEIFHTIFPFVNRKIASLLIWHRQVNKVTQYKFSKKYKAHFEEIKCFKLLN